MHYMGNTERTCTKLTLVSLYMGWKVRPLSLQKGDVPPVMHVSLYLLNWRRARLNVRLSFVTKTSASPILNKMRCTKKLSVSYPFYPPSSQVHALVMRAHLVLPDWRRSLVGASLICVSFLSFLRSGLPLLAEYIMHVR
jgi:hypothetical protein